MDDAAPDAKLLPHLIDALKAALAGSGEERLYKSGKLPGLFAHRAGPAGQAAQLAVREGLVTVVRTDDKGKVPAEWAKITPAGVAFLHAHESPRAVLEELRQSLRLTRAGVPLWLDGMRDELTQLGNRLGAEVERLLSRLDALDARVEAALRRAEAEGPSLPAGVGQHVPWALDALVYLDRRKAAGAGGDCPLAELHAALRPRHPDLGVPAFHDGLRRLHAARALDLVPHAGDSAGLAEPEYALLDGARVYAHARR